MTSCLISKSSLGWLWHRRLGHVWMKQLNKLLRHDLVRGLKDVTFEKDKPCSACQVGKQVGNAHPKKREMSTSKAFELLHMDLFGPTTYTSIGGNKYGFVIVDDYTRYTWVFFLLTPFLDTYLWTRIWESMKYRSTDKRLVTGYQRSCRWDWCRWRNGRMQPSPWVVVDLCWWLMQVVADADRRWFADGYKRRRRNRRSDGDGVLIGFGG